MAAKPHPLIFYVILLSFICCYIDCFGTEIFMSTTVVWRRCGWGGGSWGRGEMQIVAILYLKDSDLLITCSN